VLVVDDEPSICWGLEQLFKAEGFEVYSAGTADAALSLARRFLFDLILLDVRLPGQSGLEIMQSLRNATNNAPVVVMTAFGDLQTAVQAVQQGAIEYLNKPFGLEEALHACSRVLQLSRSVSEDSNEVSHGQVWHPAQLIGQSAAMQQVFHQIALVADSDLSVLITGETGTGKELVAEAIHRHSRRKERSYVPVAPVTFNESLIESELFGHVKGAYTGAVDERPGVFEAANGGTLLLDEIGDLSIGLQVKLLRVLEQGSFSRVGETQRRNCDVRVLAATHRDLHRGIEEGRFREDLLYRLGAVTLHIPALRDRPEDIPLLIRYFLSQIIYPGAHDPLDETLVRQLQARLWPGNVRELRNSVERAAALARGRRMDIMNFPLAQRTSAVGDGPASNQAIDAILAWTRQQLVSYSSVSNDQQSVDSLYERFLNLAEPALLKAVLESVSGNRKAAADTLGLHRTTLRERLRRYGLD
jgi:two-component system nitrogen regulation response regulator GlnG